MITIQKVEECKEVLAAGEKGVIDDVFAKMQSIGGDGKVLCAQMESLYDIPKNTWRPWCVANLTVTERNWLMARYQELKTFLNAIA